MQQHRTGLRLARLPETNREPSVVDPKERRAHPRLPIRLKVGYRKAQSLVTEYTKSLSKGGCCIESQHPLAVGTRFLFEMYAQGLPEPVLVEAAVVRCNPVGGHYDLSVAYVASHDKRAGLEAVLDKIFADHLRERVRKHPRIPVNLFARDGRDERVRYNITDLSLGGCGLALLGKETTARAAAGTPVLLTIESEGNRFDLSAEVVWTRDAPDGQGEARMGLRFVTLTDAERRIVELMSRLHRPLRATVTFLVVP